MTVGKFRLATVLRARKAQEDVAKGAAAQARVKVDAADKLTQQRAQSLDEAGDPAGGRGTAVVAALAARQSMAAGLAAAWQLRHDAELEAAERSAELTTAAKLRRTVEKLEERHGIELRQHLQSQEQKVVDELAVTARQRASAQGVPT